MWVLFALLGALATGATAVLSKAGLQKVDSTLGFAIQAPIILVLTWLAVAVGGRATQLLDVPKSAWLVLVGSGVSSTIAYLCYFKAISLGDASRVGPVDRLSLVFTIVFAAMFLREKLTGPVIIGAVLMTVGALVIAASPSK